MNENTSPCITIRHLYKSYASGSERLAILQDLSLDVFPGESVAITGESGCGKSTLLNIMGSLDRADAGEVVVGPYELHRMKEQELYRYRSREVGFIFQFHYLLKDFTALENVMLPAFMAGESKRQALERARQLLVEVGLEQRMQHYPSQLSGGERQRVAVARSLINMPLLVLADEPTGNLDPRNSALVIELLFAITGKHNRTLVLVTHDQHIAARAHKHYVLREGALHPLSEVSV